jgi:hypothetical protein
MTTLLITLGVLLVLVGIPGVLGLLGRACARWRHLDARTDRLQVDPAVREYMRRRSELARRAWEEADGRHVKPS